MKWIFFFIAVLTISCRETISDNPSVMDRRMQNQIIGRWIYDTGEPPMDDSTILIFNNNQSMLIIDYSRLDTFDHFRYKIRDSNLILINLAFYPQLYEIEYRILQLDATMLTLARFRYQQIQYIKNYRRVS